jgi:cytochrome c2
MPSWPVLPPEVRADRVWGRRGRALLIRGSLAFALLGAGCGDDATPPPTPQSGPPAGMTEVEWGERLFAVEGCMACHRIDGGPNVGPPLDRVAGSTRPLDDGSEVSADADYLRESLTAPGSAVVGGYEAVMPTYDWLEPAELDALLVYLQHLARSSGGS